MSFLWPPGPWVAGHFIGGNNTGRPFLAFKGDQGNWVRTIRVHYNSTRLRGIRLTFQDGTESQQIGSATDSSKLLSLSTGERLRSASLWGNGIGTRTGRIRIETTGGQILDAGKDTTGQDTFAIDVGSGFLAGFSGKEGADIDTLSFINLKPVRSVEVSNVVYREPFSPNSINPTVLNRVVYGDERSTTPANWIFSNSVVRSNSTKFIATSSFEFSANISVSAGIPLIAEVSAGYSWSVGYSRSREYEETTAVDLTWSLGGVLAPGEVITAIATCQYGNANFPYTATVNILVNTGERLSYRESGVLQNAQYAFATASHQPGRHTVEDFIPPEHTPGSAAHDDSGLVLGEKEH